MTLAESADAVEYDWELTRGLTRDNIVASSPTYDETYEAALAAGEQHPLLAKVPSANVRFVGGWA